jgi:hypothetical protein
VQLVSGFWVLGLGSWHTKSALNRDTHFLFSSPSTIFEATHFVNYFKTALEYWNTSFYSVFKADCRTFAISLILQLRAQTSYVRVLVGTYVLVAVVVVRTYLVVKFNTTNTQMEIRILCTLSFFHIPTLIMIRDGMDELTRSSHFL